MGIFGADVDARNREGCSALMAIVSWPSEHIERTVELLLNYHADITFQNNYGETALHIANRSGHEEIAQPFALTEHFVFNSC